MASNGTNAVHRPFIPQGHVQVNEKWHGSELVKEIQDQYTKVMFDDAMDLADFLPSTDMAILYLTQADLIKSPAYKPKILKLSKMYQRVIVLAEKSQSSEQYFPALQHFVVIERSLVLIPLSSTTEAAKFVAKMVKLENKPLNNPYRIKRKPTSFDAALLATVQAIPDLGEKKALDLLKEFKSIEGISSASLEKISSVIGKSSAQQVKKFFQQPFHSDKTIS